MTTPEKGFECYSLMVKTSKNLGVLRKDMIYSVASLFVFFFLMVCFFCMCGWEASAFIQVLFSYRMILHSVDEAYVIHLTTNHLNCFPFSPILKRCCTKHV